MSGWELLNDPEASARLRVGVVAVPLLAVERLADLRSACLPGVDVPLTKQSVQTVPDMGRYGWMTGEVEITLPDGQEGPLTLYGAVLLLDGQAVTWVPWDDGYTIPDESQALRCTLRLEVMEADDAIP